MSDGFYTRSYKYDTGISREICFETLTRYVRDKSGVIRPLNVRSAAIQRVNQYCVRYRKLLLPIRFFCNFCEYEFCYYYLLYELCWSNNFYFALSEQADILITDNYCTRDGETEFAFVSLSKRMCLISEYKKCVRTFFFHQIDKTLSGVGFVAN